MDRTITIKDLCKAVKLIGSSKEYKLSESDTHIVFAKGGFPSRIQLKKKGILMIKNVLDFKNETTHKGKQRTFFGMPIIVSNGGPK